MSSRAQGCRRLALAASSLLLLLLGLGLARSDSSSAAVAAAMLSPFVSSPTGVGYEQISYLWSGYGLYSQLFAMWTLPFAWAFSWRAVEERRFVLPAARPDHS